MQLELHDENNAYDSLIYHIQKALPGRIEYVRETVKGTEKRSSSDLYAVDFLYWTTVYFKCYLNLATQSFLNIALKGNVGIVNRPGSGMSTAMA